MNMRSQISMVFHLDKCIGCHTCSLACKNLWTDRPWHGVHVVEQRGDQAGNRLSDAVRRSGAISTAAGCSKMASFV